MRWFTSDTHFSHRNIIKYSNRPFRDISHMDEVLINNWNEVVAWDDTVYHLGDVALGDKTRWESIFSRLNGHKILVTGNHDAVFMGNKQRYREKYEHLYDAFDEVHDNLRGVWLDNGTIVDLSHFPYDGDSHDGDRYTEYRLHDGGRTLIHGHTHAEFEKMGMDSRVSKSKRGTLQIHVGQDSWGYKPVSEDEVIALIEAS